VALGVEAHGGVERDRRAEGGFDGLRLGEGEAGGGAGGIAAIAGRDRAVEAGGGEEGLLHGGVFGEPPPLSSPCALSAHPGVSRDPGVASAGACGPWVPTYVGTSDERVRRRISGGYPPTITSASTRRLRAMLSAVSLGATGWSSP